MTDAENKRLNGLIPEARTGYIILVDMCKARRLRLFLGSTLRTAKQQAEKHASGNSTQAVSWHMIGRACDVYPVMGLEPDLNGKRVDLFRIMHEEARKLGWHGLAFNPDGSKRFIRTSKGKIWDGGHLQWCAGYETLPEADRLAAAIAAEGPAFGLAG